MKVVIFSRNSESMHVFGIGFSPFTLKSDMTLDSVCSFSRKRPTLPVANKLHFNRHITFNFTSELTKFRKCSQTAATWFWCKQIS